MNKIALKILEATVGIESDKKELLPCLPLELEVKSLLTDFNEVEAIPYSTGLDGYISIEESEERPIFESSEKQVRFRGPFIKLEREASDLRFSLWGNQGFLYRYVLYLLEKKHGIYSFHACALYQEERNYLYVVIGGAGTGKTVYLLSGLARGLKLFSTETVHFHRDGDVISWFMGSVVDNIRFCTLKYHFPQFQPGIEIPKAEEEWDKKIALDLSSYKTDFKKLTDPDGVIILFPRVEEGREGFQLTPIEDKRKASKALFDNISQKLAETMILYDNIPILGLDEEEMALARLKETNEFVHHKTIIKIAAVLSNPHECWGDLLE
ncbi:MAG: hypothetical protein JSV96_15100 [Candidatus Aminicenantes bacterium]|nr:MAG: hypothetical protein JSV96_15100 [Candidatus Aminicenantes bacterium]